MKVLPYFQRILIIGILLLSVALQAQRYPVQVTHTVFPPYSSKLSDYVTSSDIKFRLNIALTDILGSNEQVKLKLRIQGNGFNIQSTDVVVGAPQIFLTGGVLQQFTNLDLAAYFQPNNLIGIPPQQYNRPLPEGMYTMCWEVYEVVTNQQISNPASGCANVFLLLNDPPFLNLPYRGDYILAKDPMNVIFQWTPRHTNATNVSYDFELRELWDITMDPRAAFLAAPNYYTETLNNTTLLYDISKPVLLPKRTYGWRVKAKSVTGISESSVFKNNGYSEIFYFTYANPCEVPTYVLSEALNSSTVKISWEPHFDHKEFHVQYKRADVPEAKWFEVFTYNNFAQIGNLEEGKPYMFRVGGSCNEPYEWHKTFSYSNVSQFTMPKKEDVATYNCGIIPDIEIKGRNPLKNIGVNETFTAGDFSVTVKQIFGGNGVFTGRGYITVPYLQDTKIAVTFSSIHLNDHHQLIYGVVKTTYDPTWSGVEDVNDLALGGAGNSGATTVDFIVDDVQIDPNGDIIIIGTDGEIVELPGGEDYVITDANGQTWSVDEEGNVTESGEVAEGGATNSENTNGVNNQGEAVALTADGVIVTFARDPKDLYGFDAYQKDQKQTKNLYKTLNDDYVIPYKAIPKGQETTIIANLDITDKNIQPQDIIFKTKDGIAISKIDSTATSYTLKLKGAFTDASIETQAVVKKSDKYEVAGAFIQYQAEVKNVDVVLVNTTNTSIRKVKESLQNIYTKALVKLNIKEINDFTGTLETLVPSSIIESGEDELLTQYTQDQKAINKALRARDDFNTNAYYIILTNKQPSTNKEKGIMPLGKQFGYIYANNGANERTVAHELGHGAFQLKHPFSLQDYGYPEKETNWLMDYGADVKLPFVHWRSIHNPTLRIGIFDKDSEGQSVATVMPISLAINKKKYNGKYYYGYLTPSGERIVLSDDYTPIFFHGIANDRYNEIIPGTLIGFKRKNSNSNRNVSEEKVDEVVYKAKIENGQFLGYENFYYQVPDLNGDVDTSFVIGLPYGESKSNQAQWKNYKFDSKNILEYQNGSSEVVAITSEAFQNIGLFNALKPEVIEGFTEVSEILGDGQIDVSELEVQLLSGEFNPVYVNEKKNTQGRVRNTKVHISHNERREVFLIVKIAEIYNRYPVLFKEFTNFFNNWDQSFLIKTFSDYGKWDDENIPFGGEPSQAYNTWKENLKLGSSNDALYNFYQDFLIELLAFTNQKATENSLCLTADFATKSSKEVYECIARASENELINLSLSKQIEGVKKILLSSSSGGNISDKEEIQVARILESIANGPSSNYQKALSLLETEKITYNWETSGNRSLSKTHPLWYAVFKNIQDEVFVFGEDNRQSVVESIGKIFIGSESFQEQLQNSIDPELLKEMTFEDIKTIHNQFFTYENDYQNIFRRGWSHIKTNFRSRVPGISIYDEDDFYKSVDTEITDDYLINAKQKIKWGFVKNKTEKNEDLSPFQLISFINISKNNLLKPFTAKDQNGNPQAIFIPAFTLHYASETDALQTKSDIIQTSVDLLAFLPTGGTAALNTFGKFLYYADKMSSATSMAGTAFRETDPELATYMNHLSLVTGVVSLASFSELVKDGITQKKVGEVIDPEVLKETNDQVANVNQLVADILKDDVHLKKLTPAQLEASTKILEEEITVLKTNTGFDLDKAERAVEKLKNLDVSNNSLYKNINIVGSYPNGYVDVEISELTTLHPVPRKTQPNGVNSVIEKIKAEGFHVVGNDGMHNLPVRVIELPDGTKVVVDGMHRVAAMQKLGETHIPVSYKTYDEVYKAFEAGMDRNSIDNIFIMLHIGKRTGYYSGDWMPNVPWESNGRDVALSKVDNLMKKEFPELAASSEGKLASLKALIFNDKLRTVFEKELSRDSKRINEFNSNPDLVDVWVNIQRTLDANADAFPRNIDFTGFNFDTGDNYIDIIIHYEKGKFISRVEGENEVISIEKLAKIIDATPSNYKVRLLSCSTEEAGVALSKLTERSFYANDGRVELYSDGEVLHVTPFKKYHKGVRSDLDEIPPNINIRTGGAKPIVLGKDKDLDFEIEKILGIKAKPLRDAIIALKLSSRERTAFLKYLAVLDWRILEEVVVNPSLLEPIKVRYDIIPNKEFDLGLLDIQKIQKILKKIGGYVKWKSTEKGKKNQLWDRIEIDGKDHAYVILLDQTKTDEIGGFAVSKQGTLIHTVDLPKYLREQKIAAEILRRGIEKYNPIEIEETWGVTNINHSDVSTNLSVYLSEIQKGKTRKEAAFSTPAGKLAKQNGYSGVPVFMLDTKARIDVLFTKPANKQRTRVKELFSTIYTPKNKQSIEIVVGKIEQLDSQVVDDFLKLFEGKNDQLRKFIEEPKLVDIYAYIKNILKKYRETFSQNLDFTGYNFNTGDSYTDVIIHHHDTKGFMLRFEGRDVIVSVELLAEMMNLIPVNQKIRLLSCNSHEAAIALSKLIERPFYASEGPVKLYSNGIVVHKTPFKKYHKGARSDIDEIPPNTEEGIGKPIDLGVVQNHTAIRFIFKKKSEQIEKTLQNLNFTVKERDAFLDYLVSPSTEKGIISRIEEKINLIESWKAYYDINSGNTYGMKISDFEEIDEILLSTAGYEEWKKTKRGRENKLWKDVKLESNTQSNENFINVVMLNDGQIPVGMYELSDNILEFTVNTSIKYLSPKKYEIISNFFDKVIKEFDPEGVRFIWNLEQNQQATLARYLDSKSKGREAAAFMTSDGALAKEKGFTGTPIFEQDEVFNVSVVFTKATNEKTIYKNVKIVRNPKGTPYPEKVKDVKTSELTVIHPVNKNRVEEIVEKIQNEGFVVANSGFIDVVELPNGTKLVLDGMHRVEAMRNRLNENYVPVYYNTYDDFKYDEDEIERIYFSLLLAIRSGFYKGEWMPEASWINTATKIRFLESIDESMKRDFSDFVQKDEDILRSLKVLIPEHLQEAFKNEFQNNTTKLAEFAEKPELINTWAKIKNVLIENKNAYPKNIDLAGINFNIRDEYVDVIIHHGEKGFEVRVEGKSTVIPIELLGDVINSIPENQKIRLLSCNTDKAALELSKIVARPFYASDGKVKLYPDGTVVHDTPFKKYHKGARSDIDEIPPNIKEGKGTSIVLGKEKGSSTLDEILREYPTIEKGLESIKDFTVKQEITAVLKDWDRDMLKKLNESNGAGFFWNHSNITVNRLKYFKESLKSIYAKRADLKSVEHDIYATDKDAHLEAYFKPGTDDYIIHPSRQDLTKMKMDLELGIVLDARGEPLNSHFLGQETMYVVDEYDNIFVRVHGDGLEYPHPTLIGGENPNVKGAGMLVFENGKLTFIDNNSGHFKPSDESLVEVLKILKQQIPANIFSQKLRLLGQNGEVRIPATTFFEKLFPNLAKRKKLDKIFKDGSDLVYNQINKLNFSSTILEDFINSFSNVEGYIINAVKNDLGLIESWKAYYDINLSKPFKINIQELDEIDEILIRVGGYKNWKETENGRNNKLWTDIQFESNTAYGKNAINIVMLDGSLIPVGTYERSENILEFMTNSPKGYFNSNIDEITATFLDKAIRKFNPEGVRFVWSSKVNKGQYLQMYLERRGQGREVAAFRIPDGILAKENGYTGTPTFEKDEPLEVRVVFTKPKALIDIGNPTPDKVKILGNQKEISTIAITDVSSLFDPIGSNGKKIIKSYRDEFKNEGYDLDKINAIDIVTLPNGIKVPANADSFYRTQAMSELGSESIPTKLKTYEDLLSIRPSSRKQRLIEELYVQLKIGQQTGKYKGDWFPEIDWFDTNEEFDDLLKRVDDFLNEEFPNIKRHVPLRSIDEILGYVNDSPAKREQLAEDLNNSKELAKLLGNDIHLIEVWNLLYDVSVSDSYRQKVDNFKAMELYKKHVEEEGYTLDAKLFNRFVDNQIDKEAYFNAILLSKEYPNGIKIPNELYSEITPISAKTTSPQFSGTASFGAFQIRIKQGRIEQYKGVDNETGRWELLNSEANSELNFVLTNEGSLLLGYGHYNLSRNAESVISAGKLEVRDGKIIEISNFSGHYKPSNKNLEDMASVIKKLGITSDDFKLFENPLAKDDN
ncbi:ParB N-terminal domain-containing protein [Tenacibaculum agarivorans]|uniref:ParB N-terminal domain-containing protein n=1 Tax=Tenacibaculum agarivorans TaxID=1908389 RepID=UPI000A8E8513|nr:ParB N-terminal domain-containing protein [Tenacibaculum agarivorans]